jgi:NAD(P)-dependent dehydrogenase (short-subunit alcohol dehydrogenase family)
VVAALISRSFMQTPKAPMWRATRKMRPRPDYEPRFPGSGRLRGKVALVTGGDSGIGRAVSVLFAREGAKLAIVYKEEETDARETAGLVEKEGGEALLIKGDVGKKAFCEKAVEKTIARFGRFDVLVNNAAEQHTSEDLPEITEKQIEKTFRTNIFGYIFMAQAALKHMRKGAAIVNTASVTAYRGSPHLVDYASTKGAIVAFTRSLSGQVAKKGVRVNAVAPGPIWTPLIPASFDRKEVAEFGADVPLGRAGQPNEVAPSFLFLACDDSTYFTGHVLHPNGGVILNT